jgi:hypothetical protein
MRSSCWEHCLCCRGWGGAANNKEPPAAVAAAAVAEAGAAAVVAAVVLAVPGSAGCRVTGAEEDLGGLGVVATGSAPVPGSEMAPTDEETRGGAAGVGEQRRAWDGAPVDD